MAKKTRPKRKAAPRRLSRSAAAKAAIARNVTAVNALSTFDQGLDSLLMAQPIDVYEIRKRWKETYPMVAFVLGEAAGTFMQIGKVTRRGR